MATVQVKPVVDGRNLPDTS